MDIAYDELAVVHSIQFYADGSFQAELSNNCTASGSWFTGANVLTLSIASSTPTCDQHDLADYFSYDVYPSSDYADTQVLRIWDAYGSWVEMIRPTT